MNFVYWSSLFGLLLLEIVIGLVAWRHLARRLRDLGETQQQAATTAKATTHTANTDKSTQALLAGIARIEARLQQLEQTRQTPPAPQPQSGDRAYQLAQRMARDGADAAQIAESCGIALHEAELLTRLHAHAR